MITLSCFPEKSREDEVKKQSEKGGNESSTMHLLSFDCRLGGCPCIFQRLIFVLGWPLLGGLFTSSSFDFLAFLSPLGPAGCPALSWPGLPSTLGFKPLRASFPSSKSFKAECVGKAVFRGKDQSHTEIGTRAGAGGRLWPSLVSDGSSDEALSTEQSVAHCNCGFYGGICAVTTQ